MIYFMLRGISVQRLWIQWNQCPLLTDISATMSVPLISVRRLSVPLKSVPKTHWYQCDDVQCHWNQCYWPLMSVLRLSVQLKSVLHPLTSVPWPLISVKRTLISVPESTDTRTRVKEEKFVLFYKSFTKLLWRSAMTFAQYVTWYPVITPTLWPQNGGGPQYGGGIFKAVQLIKPNS